MPAAPPPSDSPPGDKRFRELLQELWREHRRAAREHRGAPRAAPRWLPEQSAEDEPTFEALAPVSAHEAPTLLCSGAVDGRGAKAAAAERWSAVVPHLVPLGEAPEQHEPALEPAVAMDPCGSEPPHACTRWLSETANAGVQAESVAHVKRMLRKMSSASVSSASSWVSGSRSLEKERERSWAMRAWTKMQSKLSPNAVIFSDSSESGETPSRAAHVLTSPGCELVFAALVFVSTVVLAVEAQCDGARSGREQGFPRSDSALAHWDGASSTFDGFEWFFGVLFTLELLAKVLVLGRGILKDAWNALDLAVVLCWFVDKVGRQFLPMPAKMLRVMRLARLLRFVRIVKTIQGFDSLYLIVSSIRSSVSALAWSSIVVLLVEMMFALFLFVMLEEFWMDPSNPEPARQLIFEYFGTFTRSLQTMIEMLLGNWHEVTRMLTHNVSEWYMVFGVAHQLVLGFAVLEVITGVFLHETFKVATLDDGILLNETKREVKDQSRKMERFFKHADTDGQGFLDKEKFTKVLQNDDVQEWMAAMGLDAHQIDRVFTLFDTDSRGKITLEQLVAGTLSLKGQAKAMELAVVRAMVEDIHRETRRSRMGANRMLQRSPCGSKSADARVDDTLG